MQVVDIRGFHNITKITAANKDYQIAQTTGVNELSTVQSILLMAPKTEDVEFVVMTQKTGGTRESIMNVGVTKGSTRIINVKQQLPTAVSMYISATAAGATVTVNGVIATLG